MIELGECEVVECSRGIKARGYKEYPIDRERISELLLSTTWRVESGCLLWVGHHNGAGYGTFQREKVRYYVHRAVAASFIRQPLPGEDVNHVCGVPSCVEVSHLEIVTHQENSQYHTRLSSRNTSGYRGVTFHSPSGLWMARYTTRGKQHVFGYHKTPEQAAEAVANGRRSLGVHGS